MYFLYCHCVNDRPLSKSIFQFTSCETQRFSESGSAIPPDTRMAENILVDGKPLHLLRVVDLREELKKRNIKTTGTKVQLQELLIKALTHEQEQTKGNDAVPEVSAVPDNVVDNKDSPSNEDSSNGSTDNNSAENSDSDAKVASISINEQNETIKLTIRSSPRKSEHPQPACENNETDTETSQSESESSGSPEVAESKHNSFVTDVVDDAVDANSVQKPTTENDSSEMTGNHNALQNHTADKVSESNLQEELSPKKSSHSIVENKKEDVLKSPDAVVKSEKASSLSPTKKSSPKKCASPEKTSENSSARKRVFSDTSKLTEYAKEPLDSKSSKHSIRGRLLSHSKSINEDDSSKPVQKKRRWGSSQISGEPTIAKGISSDELKQLISESITESDDSAAKVSKAVVTEEETVTVPPASTNDFTNNNEKTEPMEMDAVSSTKANGFESDLKRSPSLKEDQTEETKAERTVSPSKNPESTVLFISGLVRPYTLPQLKKLICANGPIDEEKFWIDKIKSKCYAVYSTVEEAVKTREALHGLKWPQSSPKDLCVDFATFEDIDRCLHPENYENLPPPRKASPPPKQAKQASTTTDNKSKRDTVIEISKGKYDIIQNEPIRDGKDESAKSSTKDDASRNVREWDRKKVVQSERKESNDEKDNRKRSRHSPEHDQTEAVSADKKEKIRERSKTPEKLSEKKKNETSNVRETKKSESPAKMLEDLFRKTKAMPFIYWLPLSYEQAAEKAKKREILEKERLERIARRDADNKRENNLPPPPPPANRSAPAHQDIHRDRPKMQNPNRRRSPPSPPRRKRSPSPSPRRHARYSQSRSPDRRRVPSPRRRR